MSKELTWAGYKGAYQMTEEQESDVLRKCIDLATKLTGKKPVGYRAPLYQIRETTISLLEKHGVGYGKVYPLFPRLFHFLFTPLPSTLSFSTDLPANTLTTQDSSLTHHDSQPYPLPLTSPIHPPDFTKPAATWMHPTPLPSSLTSPSSSSASSAASFPTSFLVEIPCNWYGEDETPLSYLPHVPNSHGYVDVRVIEQMWKDRFTWLWEHAHEDDGADGSLEGSGGASVEEQVTQFIFPIVLHPDTSGMAHVVGMVERVLRWLQGMEGQGVEFCRYEDIARETKEAAEIAKKRS